MEILQETIDLVLTRIKDEKSKATVGDLIRLLEMETELAKQLAPRETVIQWIDPYLQNPSVEPESPEPPEKAA